MRRLLLAVLVSLSLNSAVGQFGTDGVVQYELLANGDIDAARSISNLDLFAVATNLWLTAKEQLAGKFIVRAALDKPRYRLGEPIHLFLYRLHHSTEHTFRPKSSSFQIIRPTVVDRQNVPVPLTPMGEWHTSSSNLFSTGGRYFPTNRVLINHIDLGELVVLEQPGEYLVYPKLLLYPGESPDPNRPSSVELLPIPFEVTTNRFERPAEAPASDLAAVYGQHLNELAGRSPPPSELERELAAKTAQMMKELDERELPLLEAFAAARAAEAASNQAAMATALPTSSPANSSELPAEAAPPNHHRTWWVQVSMGGLLLLLLGWKWHRRAR